MIILIPFQDRHKHLHGQRFCNIRMLLKISRRKNIGEIIKHLTIIHILVNIYPSIRIFPEKFQKIQQILSLAIDQGYRRPIIVIFSSLFLITIAESQLIYRRRFKIRIDHR